MAEDFIEAMLEAPYAKKSTLSTVAKSTKRASNANDGTSDGDEYERERDRERYEHKTSIKTSAEAEHRNGGRKHRSRSRSESNDRNAMKDDDRKSGYPKSSKDRDRNRDRGDRYKGDKERDRELRGARDGDRGGGERDKERERRRSRSKERERDPRERDHEQAHHSNPRDRRDRNKRSKSREFEGRKPHPFRNQPRRSRSPREAGMTAGGGSGGRGGHSRSHDRRMSPMRDHQARKRSYSREKIMRGQPHHHHQQSPRPFRRGGRTPPNGLGDRSPRTDLSPEERDARTVFCMQLSQRIRARDLEEFFSSVGKVRDVRLITCNKTKRFKGIAYIEFKDPESVTLALGLSGQKLLGIPISVQHTQAEKNRIANAVPAFTPKNHVGPMRLYVGSLHFNITEDMLRGIFEPFGNIDSIDLIMDTETGRSKGYGFITYHNAEDAKKALDQLNGFELAGRPMKVGNVTERLDMNTTSLDTDEMDRSGIDLGATGRLQLMFKLAEGAGLAVPQAAANALLATAPQPVPQVMQTSTPAIATQCFLLSNMFDARTETNPTWDSEIRDDVLEECAKHGGVLHMYVDTASPTGNVYVKCPSITTAVLAVNALHGRWFAGRVITAAYVPLINYHSLFPDAIAAVNLLAPTRKPTDGE